MAARHAPAPYPPVSEWTHLPRQAAKAAVVAQGGVVKAAKEAAKSGDAAAKESLKSEVEKLTKLKEEAAEIETRVRMSGGLPLTPAGKVDYTDDFFGRPSYLTVSGQLEGEMYACALTNIYTVSAPAVAAWAAAPRRAADSWHLPACSSAPLSAPRTRTPPVTWPSSG